MSFASLIRRTVTGWLLWRARMAMFRAYPELRDLSLRQAECRRGHKRGSAAIQRSKQARVHAALAAETRRG